MSKLARRKFVTKFNGFFSNIPTIQNRHDLQEFLQLDRNQQREVKINQYVPSQLPEEALDVQ